MKRGAAHLKRGATPAIRGELFAARGATPTGKSAPHLERDAPHWTKGAPHLESASPRGPGGAPHGTGVSPPASGAGASGTTWPAFLHGATGVVGTELLFVPDFLMACERHSPKTTARSQGQIGFLPQISGIVWPATRTARDSGKPPTTNHVWPRDKR